MIIKGFLRYNIAAEICRVAIPLNIYDSMALRPTRSCSRFLFVYTHEPIKRSMLKTEVACSLCCAIYIPTHQ